MTTSEKAAYLKGLADGFGIDPSSKEGKLLSVITDILEDLALDVEDLRDDLAEFENGLDAVSEDLADVEDLLFDDEDEDLFDNLDEDDDEDEDVFETVYEVRCPVCGELVTFEESTLDEGSIICPSCGESLEFDLSESEDDE